MKKNKKMIIVIFLLITSLLVKNDDVIEINVQKTKNNVLLSDGSRDLKPDCGDLCWG